MKPIIALYVEMLRDMGLNSILECKRRITKADLRYYRITPEQHRIKYLYKALEHIKKTSPRAKLSVKIDPLNQYRKRKLAELEALISQAPNKKLREHWECVCAKIEAQITPAAGMA